jgi:hypothetical protein
MVLVTPHPLDLLPQAALLPDSRLIFSASVEATFRLMGVVRWRRRTMRTIEPKILYFGSPVALISSLNQMARPTLRPFLHFGRLGGLWRLDCWTRRRRLKIWSDMPLGADLPAKPHPDQSDHVVLGSIFFTLRLDLKRVRQSRIGKDHHNGVRRCCCG